MIKKQNLQKVKLLQEAIEKVKMVRQIYMEEPQLNGYMRCDDLVNGHLARALQIAESERDGKI
jgi:hypothetical protein